MVRNRSRKRERNMIIDTLILSFGILILFCILSFIVGFLVYRKQPRIAMPVMCFVMCMGSSLSLLITTIQYTTTDQQSNSDIQTITIYDKNREIIAQYTGKIDIKNIADDYVQFDYEGKRYTYYNCSLESIAEIEN